MRERFYFAMGVLACLIFAIGYKLGSRPHGCTFCDTMQQLELNHGHDIKDVKVFVDQLNGSAQIQIKCMDCVKYGKAHN